MKKFLVLILLLQIKFLSAQITDDFSDSDFTNNPTWNGDQSKFEVNAALQLHLNAPAVSDTAYLFTSNSLLNDIEWDFFFIMDFSPSSSNYLKVYLTADQSNFKQPLNGYFLKMGEDGSNDAIDLYLQQGTTETLIMQGIAGHVAASTNNVSVKVTRDATGNWAVYSDVTGGTNYSLEGTTTDNTITATSYFGFLCKYTSSRSTLFYFDNIYVGPPVVDVTPPSVVAVTPISSTQLDMKYSEPVDQSSAQNVSNYTVNNGIGSPSTASLDGGDHALVHLAFSNSFQNGIQDSIYISGVKDLAGNAMPLASLPFIFYEAQGNDVVINEIMADPSPVVGLPDAEYVELFNRSQFPVDLTNWKISDGTNTATLPTVLLLPGSFLILCSTTDASLLQPFGSVAGLSSFPSLNNDGDDLTLSDASSNLVNEVQYDISWYQDVNKSNGGYSLELIDPLSSCSGKSNWHASLDATGGTPGRKNSVLGNFIDTIPPQLIRAVVINSSTIELFFDGALDVTSASNVANYSITSGISIQSAQVLSPDFSTVDLQINPAIDSNSFYTIAVNGISDCSGNMMTLADSAQIAIPSAIHVSNILINEILFNPKSGGYDYVEIYNNTQKIFDLKNLKIANADDFDSLNTISDITTDSYLLFPDQYLVLTENPDWVKQNYFAENPDWFIQINSMPSFNDAEGRVVLLTDSNVRIDELHYVDSWQFPLINNVEGVALERIDPNRPTQDSMNWHSAASTIGFGTPSYKNSQYSTAETGSEITLSPKVFSPDEDGFNDVLNIAYQFDQPGYTSNIKIFDSQGRETRNLVKNALLAQSGTFTWDGTTENGTKAKVGTYIIYVEIFDLNGTVKHYKKACVVAARKS